MPHVLAGRILGIKKLNRFTSVGSQEFDFSSYNDHL